MHLQLRPDLERWTQVRHPAPRRIVQHRRRGVHAHIELDPILIEQHAAHAITSALKSVPR